MIKRVHTFDPGYTVWLDLLEVAREVLPVSSMEPEIAKVWLCALVSRPVFEKFLRQSNTTNFKQGVA